MKRLWPYLLLNVVVSAVTMLAVLLIWNATHRVPAFSGNTNGTVIPGSNATPAPTRTLPAKNEKLFEIESVVGTGDLNSEYAHIIYLGDDPLDLQGWKVLKDSQVIYTFPAFVIYKGGAFNLYTEAGSNTAIDLYIGRDSTLWQSGDVLRIKDPNGTERLNFRIP